MGLTYSRMDDVAETDVYLHWDLSPFEKSSEYDANPLVIRVFLDAFTNDGIWIERHTIVHHFDRTDGTDDPFEILDGVVNASE